MARPIATVDALKVAMARTAGKGCGSVTAGFSFLGFGVGVRSMSG